MVTTESKNIFFWHFSISGRKMYFISNDVNQSIDNKHYLNIFEFNVKKLKCFTKRIQINLVGT